MLPTLNQFISKSKERQLPSNSYVYELGFKDLYVRYNPRRIINFKEALNVLDIANVTVTKKRKGIFTSLVKRIQKEHPEINIYVENVFFKYFAEGLVKMGFIEVEELYKDYEFPKSFFLKAKIETIVPNS